MTELRKTERFQQIPIFSNLRVSEVAEILRISREEKFAAGSDIFAPGAAPDCFYMIVEGRVEIRRPKAEGKAPMTIAVLSDRSVFGEMSFLHNRPRSAFAHVVDDTRVTRVDGVAFREMVERGDLPAYKVIHNFALLISSRLRRMEAEMVKVLDRLGPETRRVKLAELQEFRQTLFEEWSF